MKKLLLLAAAAVMAGTATTHAEDTWTPQSRSAWTVYGCSQQNNGYADKTTDGGFKHIFDDNTDTYWHASWASGAADKTAGHYLIIDRGETAEPYNGFGYLPRQSAGGNGYVTAYRVYAVNSIDQTAMDSSCSHSEQQAIKSGAHDNMATYLSTLTPAAQGEFNYTWAGGDGGDVTDHNERRVQLDAAHSERYLIFVIDNAIGSESPTGTSPVWGNCAEFHTYTVAPDNVREKAQTLLDSAIDRLTPGYFSKEHPEYAPLAEALAGNDDSTLSAAYNAALAADLSLISTTALYTISNTRGTLFDPARDDNYIWASVGTTELPSDDSQLWGFIEIDGKYYLYNAKSLKFANAYSKGSAYDLDDTKDSFASGYNWYLTTTAASAIKIDAEAAPQVTIGGDKDMTIAVTDGYATAATNPVTVIDYFKAGDAGVPMTFTYAKETDAETTAGLTAELTATFADIDYAIKQSSTGANVVGHYTDEVSDNIAKIRSEYYAEKDYKLRQALSVEHPYIELRHDCVYTLMLPETDTWHYVDNGAHLLGQRSDLLPDNNYYWICDMAADGTCTFYHRLRLKGSTEPTDARTLLESDGLTSFPELTRSGLGLTRLTPEGADYKVKYISDDKTLATSETDQTSISHITADTTATTQWYDLAGRRVAATTRGFIISSNGHKAIVR